MSPRRPSTILIPAMLAAALLSGTSSPAFSAGITNPVDPNPLALQQSRDELRMLENRIQRQQFQQQQQQFRDQDRQMVPQPRLEVPQIRPSCQLQPSGSGFASRCR
jgi:hypothetical protein